jgi:hypothetical protein
VLSGCSMPVRDACSRGVTAPNHPQHADQRRNDGLSGDARRL